MRHLRRIRQSRWVGPVGSAVTLLIGSAVPLPSQLNPDYGLLGPDKALHAVGHMGLTAAVLSALAPDRYTVCVAAFVVMLSTIYGFATERLQERIPGRQFESGDILAGLCGSLFGVIVWRRRVR